MTAEQKLKLRKGIDMLDAIMEKTPNQELADASNLLEELYQEIINND